MPTKFPTIFRGPSGAISFCVMVGDKPVFVKYPAVFLDEAVVLYKIGFGDIIEQSAAWTNYTTEAGQILPVNDNTYPFRPAGAQENYRVSYRKPPVEHTIPLYRGSDAERGTFWVYSRPGSEFIGPYTLVTPLRDLINACDADNFIFAELNQCFYFVGFGRAPLFNTVFAPKETITAPAGTSSIRCTVYKGTIKFEITLEAE